MDESALLAAIYAAPDDDRPRLVYADWLQERGDRRGELIALQYGRLRRSPTTMARKRERWILKKHARAWLGALWDNLAHRPVVVAERQYEVRFERGFLSDAVVAFRNTSVACAVGDARWSTVRTLVANDDPEIGDGVIWRPAKALYLDDALFGVRAFIGAHREVALELLRDPRPRKLRTLHMKADPGRAHDLRHALVHSTLPELRELGFAPVGGPVVPSAYDWLWLSPLGSRLEELTLTCPTSNSVLAAWRAPGVLPPNIRLVRFTWGPKTLNVTPRAKR